MALADLTTKPAAPPAQQRVVSLLPAATEIVAALGAGEQLVAISHECDYPPEVVGLPRVTSTPIDASESSLSIDGAVREAMARGEPVIAVDSEALRRARPDVVITQSLCEVCAVDGRAVRSLATALDPRPAILSLDATDLTGVHADIRRVAGAIGREIEAEELVGRMISTLDQAAGLGPVRTPRPRVVCIEWTDPVFLAGHWVPELVAAAGGLDVGAEAGALSVRTTWSDVADLGPDVILVMLCGFDVPRARAELSRVSDPIARDLLDTVPAAVIDGNAYTSRAGPRLAECVALLRDELARLSS